MADLSNFTDEDLKRLIQQTIIETHYRISTIEKTKKALIAFFKMLNLHFIADAIELFSYVFDRILNILSKIFKRSDRNRFYNDNYSDNSDSWW